jgi:hypothetical protein
MRFPQRLLHDYGVIDAGVEKYEVDIFECGQRDVGDGEGLATVGEDPSLDEGFSVRLAANSTCSSDKLGN